MGGKRHLESPRVAAPTTISGRILHTPAPTPAPTPATPTNCTVKCTKAPRQPLPTQGPPRASPTAALAVRHAQAEARSSHPHSYPSSPHSYLPGRGAQLSRLVDGAERHVVLTSMQIWPSGGFLRSLVALLARGGCVEVVGPMRRNSFGQRIASWLNRYCAQSVLARHGRVVYRECRTGSMLHAKHIIIDGQWRAVARS